jgi:transcriptional regulator with XRE-family HTH domain
MYNSHMVMKKRKTPKTERLCRAFGARLVQLRGEREWSQKQLSGTTGVDQWFISRIESGQTEPCLGSLAVFAKAFDLTLSELLEGVR